MKRFLKFYLALSVLTFCAGFFTQLSYAQGTMHTIEVVQQSLHKLTWKAPLERTNGDPLAPEDIRGYKVERLNDEGNILETIELDANTLELAISLVPNDCMVYKAYAVATDGSPPSEESGEGTLTSEPTDAIRICVVPPRKPRDFRVN